MAKQIYPCPYCFEPVNRTIFTEREYVHTGNDYNRPKEYSHYDCWKVAAKTLRETAREYDNVINM